MNDFYSLELYAEERGLYTNPKGKLFDYMDGEKITIISTSIEVQRIELDSKEGETLLLNIFLNNNKIDEEIQAKYTKNSRIICNWKEENKKFDKYINPCLREYALEFIKDYFIFCIKKYVEIHPEFFAKCGWMKMNNEFGFLGINFINIKPRRSMEKNLFDGLINSGDYKMGFEKQCEEYRNFEDLFNLVLKDKCAFITFVYSIHSIMWHGIYGKRREKVVEFGSNEDIFFSLCIYGKDIPRAKILANMLVNAFKILQEHWSVIPKDYSLSVSSVSDRDLSNIMSYHSVPVIVTSKTNKIIKSNSMMKKIHRMRSNGELFIFPVYISESPIIVDEMINCSCDELYKAFASKDVDLFYDIHKEFCFMIFEYVKYFSFISDTINHRDRDPYNKIALSIKEVLDGLEKSDEWIQNHIPEILLDATVEGFLSFLETTPLQIWVKQFRKKADEVFFNTDDMDDSNDIIEDTTAGKDAIFFIKELLFFMKKTIKSKQNREWIFEDKEKRGGEECYYLHSKNGIKEFQKHLCKKHYPVIKERQFVKILKDNNILKLPCCGVSNTFKRKNKYFYVMKKEAFGPFFNNDDIIK